MIYQDKDIAKILHLSTSDIIYHFKKGHIKGVHLDNVGWIASHVEAKKFISSYVKNKNLREMKNQRNLFNLKEIEK